MKAVLYGAGNIGRGFMGQLFHQSGYELVFVDVVDAVIEQFNKDRSYPINIVSDKEEKLITITGARAVDGKVIEAVADEIATADLMSTSVGVRVLPYIIKPVAAGLRKRWEIGNDKPLNIIIAENLLEADSFIRDLMKKELSEEEYARFLETVGLVEASIGRMVPMVPAEAKAKNPLVVFVEPYCELPVDKNAFKGEIPAIVNLKPFAPFEFFIKRKLFIHNMSHAVCSYLGFLKGYTYTYESMADTGIKLICKYALGESVAALCKQYDYPYDELTSHADELLFRFANHRLGDTVARVGKDPVRKLSNNDRLIGTVKSCLANGILPVYVCIGIAAGLLFAQPDDEAAVKVSSYCAEHGVRESLREFCGITEETDLPHVDRVISLVEEFYGMLKAGKDLSEIAAHAEYIRFA
ncbi:MAG: mannitol dehydrogenase [Abditibacteriota bacterium]|nr:mannitol dehydrogenase [Abditibacteriota bacterium]